jgi:flagella basal body P-ring formation protein FlgA
MTSIVNFKKPDMKKLLMAVAMTAFIVNSAQAAEPASEVALAGDVVTVGDVFPGVTHDAAYVLSPAPAYGKTMTLSANDLKRISDAFNLGWQPASNLTQTSIRRASQDIGPDKISAALQSALAQKLDGQKFQATLAERNMTLHVPENAATDLSVSDLRYDLARGEFSAMLTAGNEQKPVTGRLIPVTSVPVLKAQLQKGALITAEDLDYVDVRNSDLGANVLVSADQLIGMSPRRGIAALKPIASSDVASPVVVKKGEIVTMVLQNSEMTLTTQGKALENGAVGETVRIVNPSSGQSVEGVVTAVKTVSITSPGAAGI